MVELWQRLGHTVLDLPVDADGARVEDLGGGVDVVSLTPAHQFPLGGALSPRRRGLVCDWAARTGGYIVEDDYDGEFRFDRRPVAALQRSAPDRVIYAGSVSKTLSPDLRIGWLVLPDELVAPTAHAVATLTGGVPLLNQLALADFIASGDYERHVRAQRREYARRRLLLRNALHAHGLTVPGIPAGLHAVIEPAATVAPSGTRVAVHTLGRYSRTHPVPDALVVGFATPARKDVDAAVAALMSTLAPPS
ncbi:aminotransferase class I/II-fold pyridoxal phosphate-dependent enzyme [Winogradskya humida]|uniref:aminotransferase class I/II-fold pyridoxal phosphate-dependent enzyme n=1 Tax=Winogradskya humida TaxID=113566 RepID=UPI001EF2849B|nr:PLP-dependent aminotransferase family protein [Actinoplanes humidus]